MVASLRTRPVLAHLLCMGPPVRKEGAEIEKLKGTQESGNDPEYDQCRNLHPQFQHVESHCHDDQLKNRGVTHHEPEPPGKEILGLHIKIGVLFRTRIPVMVPVVLDQPPVRHPREQEHRQVPDGIVDPLHLRHRTVHRIMAGDE